MGAVKRFAILLGAILAVGFTVSLGNQPGVRHVPELLALVLVPGLTTVLGLLTLDHKELRVEFRRVFSKSSISQGRSNNKMLAQLALYALVSGLILAIVQVLACPGMAQPASGELKSISSVQMPFLSLLYGVLTGLGLWVVSGADKPSAGESPGSFSQMSRNQMMVAFCVLLLTTGVLSVLILGLNIADGTTSDTAFVELAEEIVQPMRQGADMVWRPVKSGLAGQAPLSHAGAAVRRGAAADEPILASNSTSGRREALPVLRWEVQTKPDVAGAAVEPKK